MESVTNVVETAHSDLDFHQVGDGRRAFDIALDRPDLEPETIEQLQVHGHFKQLEHVPRRVQRAATHITRVNGWIVNEHLL